MKQVRLKLWSEVYNTIYLNNQQLINREIIGDELYFSFYTPIRDQVFNQTSHVITNVNQQVRNDTSK